MTLQLLFVSIKLFIIYNNNPLDDHQYTYVHLYHYNNENPLNVCTKWMPKKNKSLLNHIKNDSQNLKIILIKESRYW